ncbi:hypothetical protein JSY14_09300 [Brachybacterium sp. EF45031]|uniref:monovalent cation/H+ antiporter complex subunit F n=1 Tax=Brachybacterium sillae TaxID=2810536 RepID=UPI00217CD98C|nr:monovalent cation/H+ antiporter complex subunit F [Brachybacterium sillae]MCS6712209.1 hypothetical protein [Brachybacterium sillae]
MSAFEIVLLMVAAVHALAAAMVIHRMIVGPTILDRAVAVDLLTVLLVMGIALYTAETGATWGVVAMLSLTACAFVATLAVARFVAREELRGGRPGTAAEDTPTSTGAHDAIHVTPSHPDFHGADPGRGSTREEEGA